MTESAISIKCPIYNSTEDPINFEAEASFNQPFIVNPADYAVAITRVQLPSAELECFRPIQRDKYKIAIIGNSLSNVNLTQNEITIPNDRDDDPDYKFGAVRMYSPENVLEILNLMMIRSFEKYAVANAHSVVAVNRAFVINSAPAIEHIPPLIDTIPVVANAARRISDINLQITKFKISMNDGTSMPINFSISLVNPAGVKVLVAAFLLDSWIYDWDPDNDHPPIEFTSAAYRNLSGPIYPSAGDSRTIRYRPAESFYKLYKEADGDWASANGNWQLVIDADPLNLRINMEYKLTVTLALAGYPNIPPVMHFNDEKKLVMEYQPEYIRKSVHIALSPFMKEILNFGNSFLEYIAIFNKYLYKYPTVNLSQDLISHTQSLSTFYMFSNITAITVNSQDWGVYGDILTDSITNDVLQDFVISQNNDELGYLEFSDASSIRPWRVFPITVQSPLKRYSFQVYAVYGADTKKPGVGERVLVRIPPGGTGVIRISFFNMRNNSFM